MQEVQYRLEQVGAVKMSLTDAEKKCKALEIELLPLQEAAVSITFKALNEYHVLASLFHPLYPVGGWVGGWVPTCGVMPI